MQLECPSVFRLVLLWVALLASAWVLMWVFQLGIRLEWKW